MHLTSITTNFASITTNFASATSMLLVDVLSGTCLETTLAWFALVVALHIGVCCCLHVLLASILLTLLVVVVGMFECYAVWLCTLNRPKKSDANHKGLDCC